ncbi:uncharacterized protein AB675_12052 [Cyphellophora attinorum]|uniref:Uncharacterized protein n=1 Tax=Cyphellophora attinorum TaxID=1664694 RepID=A0A0N1H6E6_9EURO|nr:uncharacterized protein AB675_12052 [Phialophora attinorum]KPI38266.1 hypothetical protein AB675_12052 [Phialophora attinorum]
MAASTFNDEYRGFPEEILDGICKALHDKNDDDTLASLRLCTKKLKLITEPYLFSRIYLDTRIDSLEFLENISRCDLRNHVTSVSIELQQVFVQRTFNEWKAQSRGEYYHGGWFSHEDRWFRPDACPTDGKAMTDIYLQDYANAPSKATKSMHKLRSPFYRAYEAARIKEEEILQIGELAFQSRLEAAFSQFPRLSELSCTRASGSKYLVADANPKIARCFVKHFAAYAGAAVRAFLQHSSRPVKLNLHGITLPGLGGSSQTGPMAPWHGINLASLETFVLKLYHRDGFVMNNPLAELSRSVSPILRGATAIKELTLNTNVCRYQLPLPTGIETMNFARLQLLDLQGFKFTQSQIVTLLRAVSPTLRRLKMTRVEVVDSVWLDVFSALHSCGLGSVDIEFGKLLEGSARRGHYWLIRGCDESCHLGSKCLWQKVLLWIKGQMPGVRPDATRTLHCMKYI